MSNKRLVLLSGEYRVWADYIEYWVLRNIKSNKYICPWNIPTVIFISGVCVVLAPRSIICHVCFSNFSPTFASHKCINDEIPRGGLLETGKSKAKIKGSCQSRGFWLLEMRLARSFHSPRLHSLLNWTSFWSVSFPPSPFLLSAA